MDNKRIAQRLAPTFGPIASGAQLTSYEPTFREKATDWMRGLLFTDDRAGQRKAERLSNVLETMTPYGVATGADDVREAAGQGDYATAGLMSAMAMVPGPNPKGIRAYHGSPHSFDRFSMDKIGTGEGAQAYGHGLYFAENEGVAKSYRDVLSKKSDGLQPEIQRIDARMNELIAEMGVTSGRKQAKLAAEYEALQAKRDNLGSMYEVNIKADPNDFLDWDKPLSEQPKNALDKLKAVIDSHGIQTSGVAGNGKQWELSGGEIYDRIATVQGGVGAGRDRSTLALQEAGIPGIKYLDAGSRGKGDGSRNYVVFDDKLIEIVRKYGIAGASAMLGYNLLDNVDSAQAAQLQALDQNRSGGQGW